MFILFCVLFFSTTFSTSVFAIPNETSLHDQSKELTDLNAKLAGIEEKVREISKDENTTPEKIIDLQNQTQDLLKQNLPLPLYKKVYTSIKNFASTIKSYVTGRNTFRTLILAAELYAAYYFFLKPNEAGPKNLDSISNQTSQDPTFKEVMSEFFSCLFSFSPGTCDAPKEIFERLKKEKTNMSN